MSRLKVTIDGKALPEDEARALWQRFSAHMDLHQGDFAGFAAKEGHAGATVAVVGGVPTLQLGKAPPANKPAKAKGPSGKGKPRKRGKRGGKRRQQAKHDGGQGGSARPKRKKP